MKTVRVVRSLDLPCTYVDRSRSTVRVTFTVLTLVLISANLLGCSALPVSTQPTSSSDSDEVFRVAFEQHKRNLQVEGRGVVTRILSDDNDGSKHQRFILELGSGQSLLIAHNIDLAPRIQGLQTGDEVEFRGEYEWNPEGGVIHWTHHDPAGRHQGGWLQHNGDTYQ